MELDYPYHVDRHGKTASTGGLDHIRDLIEQVMFTTPGERVMRPDFGSGLLQAVFAPNSPELATAMEFSTRAALQRWLGDVIDVQALAFTAVDAVLRVELAYSLKGTGERRSDVFELDSGVAAP